MPIKRRPLPLRMAIASIFATGLPTIIGVGMDAAQAEEMTLYVDQKTKQVYTSPGRNRVRLGNFKQVEENAPAEDRGGTEGRPGNITELQEKLEEKDSQIQALEEKTNVLESKISGESKNTPLANVKLGDKGLEIDAGDGKFKVAIGGRLQIDSEVNFNDRFRNSSNNRNFLDDGIGMRRARMHMEGTFYKYTDFKFEYDFVRGGTNNNPGINGGGITDAWLRFNYLDPFSITMGQFKEPISLESVTSNRYLTFLERNYASNAFVESANPYKLGIAFNYYAPRFTTTMGLITEPINFGGNVSGNTTASSTTGSTVDQLGNANRGGSVGSVSWEAIGRVTILPWFKDPAHFLHVGAAGAYRDLNNTYNLDNTLRSNPLSFGSQAGDVDRTNLVSTGNLTTGALNSPTRRVLDHLTRVGGEAAFVYGPFSVQGEYMRTGLDGFGYGSRDHFTGFYGFASYFLTGESRPYNPKRGAFDRVMPFSNFSPGGGLGAWEIAVRYHYLDLNSPATIANGAGGRMQGSTVALNWYLNPHVRLMANYEHIWNIHSRTVFNGANPDIFMFRGQIDW